LRSIEFESSLKLSDMMPGKPGSSHNLTENALLLSRGRDAIRIIIDDMGLLESCGILLPAFACGEIYEPFSKAGLKNYFYRINEDLTPNLSHIREMKGDCKVVLVINYFGFLQPNEVYDQLKDWGLIVIEDGSHSLLSAGSGSHGDYYFASLRKLLPVLDGAILRKKDKAGFRKVRLKKSGSLTKFRSFRALGQLIKGSEIKKSRGTKQWLIQEMFARAEKEVPRYPGPAAMSNLSRNILNRLKLGLISESRRRNYEVLGERLGEVQEYAPVFKKLPDAVVPYGFPVLSGRRTLWVTALDKLKIQVAPLWSLSKAIPDGVLMGDDRIYRQMMLFPVGQDYTIEDMNGIVARIRGVLENGV